MSAAVAGGKVARVFLINALAALSSAVKLWRWAVLGVMVVRGCSSKGSFIRLFLSLSENALFVRRQFAPLAQQGFLLFVRVRLVHAFHHTPPTIRTAAAMGPFLQPRRH